MKREYRDGPGEYRTTDEAQGLVEAYLTRWGTVDSYNSTFLKGAFKKTFKERGARKIRLFWNHRDLAGKILACNEDDNGAWVRAQFNLDTQVGRDAFAHVRAGDVDCFSFGFNTVADGFKNGVREIREIVLYECGPVIFEANPNAEITDIRATDFNETLTDKDMRNRGWRLVASLDETLDDIMWQQPQAEWPGLIEAAIEAFRDAYLGWIEAWLARYGDAGTRSIPVRNEMGAMLYEFAGEDGLTGLAQRTALRLEDLKTVAKGGILPIDRRSNLSELPEAIRKAHHRARRDRVEELCAELRAGGFTQGEKMRLSALLEVTDSGDGDLLESLEALNKNITGDTNV